MKEGEGRLSSLPLTPYSVLRTPCSLLLTPHSCLLKEHRVRGLTSVVDSAASYKCSLCFLNGKQHTESKYPDITNCTGQTVDLMHPLYLTCEFWEGKTTSAKKEKKNKSRTRKWSRFISFFFFTLALHAGSRKRGERTVHKKRKSLKRPNQLTEWLSDWMTGWMLLCWWCSLCGRNYFLLNAIALSSFLSCCKSGYTGAITTACTSDTDLCGSGVKVTRKVKSNKSKWKYKWKERVKIRLAAISFCGVLVTFSLLAGKRGSEEKIGSSAAKSGSMPCRVLSWVSCVWLQCAPAGTLWRGRMKVGGERSVQSTRCVLSWPRESRLAARALAPEKNSSEWASERTSERVDYLRAHFSSHTTVSVVFVYVVCVCVCLCLLCSSCYQCQCQCQCQC